MRLLRGANSAPSNAWRADDNSPTWTNANALAARCSRGSRTRRPRRRDTVDASSAAAADSKIKSNHSPRVNFSKRSVNFSLLTKPPRGRREEGFWTRTFWEQPSTTSNLFRVFRRLVTTLPEGQCATHFGMGHAKTWERSSSQWPVDGRNLQNRLHPKTGTLPALLLPRVPDPQNLVPHCPHLTRGRHRSLLTLRFLHPSTALSGCLTPHRRQIQRAGCLLNCDHSALWKSPSPLTKRRTSQME